MHSGRAAVKARLAARLGAVWKADKARKAEEAAYTVLKEGFQAAANRFNVKKEKKPKPAPEETPGQEAAPEHSSPPGTPPDGPLRSNFQIKNSQS